MPRRPPLSPLAIAAAEVMHAGGQTWSDLARFFGIDETTLRAARKRLARHKEDLQP